MEGFSPDSAQREQQVISPFADTKSIPPPASKRWRWFWPLWVAMGLVVLVMVAAGGHFTLTYLNDPARTMPPFPVDKYFADFQPWSGGKFKADFTVLADLGWKPDVGRLMVFTAPNDVRPIPVLIPPGLSTLTFTRGQNYHLALGIGEGGLIYADSCEKE